MQDPIVIIGLGEMGGVFARGFLRLAHPVFPVTRGMDMEAEARALPEPALVLLAVAEKDLHPTLERLPEPWRGRLGLLQNELLPRDWQTYGISDPTVISVWFEKKKGQDAKVVVPSPIHGPRAALIRDALAALDIPSFLVADEASLLYELVRKNLYILTTNIAGLECGGTVQALWAEHERLARAVAEDVLDIQDWLTGRANDRERLIEGMLEAFEGDPSHKCMGRSAPARLARALALAGEAGLEVSTLRSIAASHDVSPGS
jgi:hypothetical protein